MAGKKIKKSKNKNRNMKRNLKVRNRRAGDSLSAIKLSQMKLGEPEWWQTESELGIPNIKVYGREINSINRNKPLDRSVDDVILYLCGHRDGFDGTETGFMLTEDSFKVLTYNIIKWFQHAIVKKSIKLSDEGVLVLIYFLEQLEEHDLIGKMENKAAVLKKWTEEMERALIDHGNEIEIFMELYE